MERRTITARKKILIVDDDDVVLDELSQAITNPEYELDYASDGFEAAKKIYKNKDSRPDLILLDFKMQSMNGFQVCEILKAEEDTSGIPIIAITALTGEEDIRKIHECGVMDYMAKPFNIESLLKMIEEVLVRKKGRIKG